MPSFTAGTQQDSANQTAGNAELRQPAGMLPQAMHKLVTTNGTEPVRQDQGALQAVAPKPDENPVRSGFELVQLVAQTVGLDLWQLNQPLRLALAACCIFAIGLFQRRQDNRETHRCEVILVL